MKEYNDKLKSEIQKFREDGYRFLKKELTVAEFKGISGGMGVYAQRGGEKFMIRLRIPSGIMTFSHLKLITDFAEKYGLSKIHLTTRQAIQLHDLTIDEVCEIMDKAIDHGLYSRGGGGNFPRNVTLSPLSGVDENEAFDVTPFAVMTGDYLMERITEYKLPRKLKIAFSNNNKDTAGTTYNDLGFLAVLKDGQPYFKLYIAGGLGNNPALALPFDEYIQPEDVLYHVEAAIRLFMAEGDYNNKGKARMRYIPRRMGVVAFMDCYKEHLKSVKESVTLKGIKGVAEAKNDRFLEENPLIIPQRQSGYYTVEIHPLCGLMSLQTLKQLITFLEGLKKADIRLTMTESMYIRNLSLNEAKELLEITKAVNLTGNVEKSVTCIGTPTCQVGMEESRALVTSIIDRLHEHNISQEFLVPIHVSGCLNSCARHQVNPLGFTGLKKRVENTAVDAFELHVGGVSNGEEQQLGITYGAIKKEDIPSFIETLTIRLNEYKKDFITYFTEEKDEFETLLKPYLI